ncbi:MAG: ACT domain-containing protein [Acidobacteria bacterium]|nr:ACT domain-containing protein [Acidobacteriota bacterium]
MSLMKQLSITVQNRPGALAEVCSELARVAVNISAIMVANGQETAILRVVVNTPEAARKVLQGMGLKFTEEEVIAAHVKDRPGSLGRVTRKLAEHGINIEYAYGSIEKGSDQAMIILSVSDLGKAADLLK